MRNLMLCILLLSAYTSAEVRFYGSLGTKKDAVSVRSTRMMNRFIEENLPPIAEINVVEVTFPWNRLFESDILPDDRGFAHEFLERRK